MDWLPASAQHTIDPALADSTTRPIGVQLFFEDPRARTPHIWATPSERIESHVVDDGKTVDIWINSSDDHRMVTGIQLGTFATSAREGFERCLSIALSTMLPTKRTL